MSALTAVWTVATDCVPENLRHEPGHHEILGFTAYRNESKDIWRDFLKSLKKRGLKGVLMITSDAHEGIIHAISAVFPTVPWQRCRFHFLEISQTKRRKGIRRAIMPQSVCRL